MTLTPTLMSRLSDQQSFDSDSTNLTFNTRFDGPSNEGDCLHPYTTLRMYGRLTNLLRSTDLIELALNIDHFSTALASRADRTLVGQGARVLTEIYKLSALNLINHRIRRWLRK